MTNLITGLILIIKSHLIITSTAAVLILAVPAGILISHNKNQQNNTTPKTANSTQNPNNPTTTNTPVNGTTTQESNNSNPTTPSNNPTSSSGTTTTPSSNPTSTNNSTPEPEPVVDKSLKGLTGMVATVKVGQALYAPVHTPAEASVTYQWKWRTGSAPGGAGIYESIPGATSNPYYPTANYLNKYLTVFITGTNGWTGTLQSPTEPLVVN